MHLAGKRIGHDLDDIAILRTRSGQETKVPVG